MMKNKYASILICTFLIILFTPKVVYAEENLIYFAGEILDTIDLFRILIKDFNDNANDERLAIDLMRIWAQVDKMADDINYELLPKSQLVAPNVKKCRSSIEDIIQTIEKVASSTTPTVSAGIEAMILIGPSLPQTIIHCGNQMKVERKYKSYRRHYVVNKVNPENLE